MLHSVEKFHDFTITQNLREINSKDSRSAKFAVLTHLETLNFDFHENLQIDKIQNLKIGKNGSFRTSRFSKIDFT